MYIYIYIYTYIHTYVYIDIDMDIDIYRERERFVQRLRADLPEWPPRTSQASRAPDHLVTRSGCEVGSAKPLRATE